jgi:hypothetical protein
MFYIVAGNLLGDRNEIPFTMKKVILCGKKESSGFGSRRMYHAH